DGDALAVALGGGIAHIVEVEIENDFTAIDAIRQYQVRIHVAPVEIDHEIGILPEIPGAVAGAGCRSGGVLVRCDHRTGLQAVSVFGLDGVLLVLEHAVQRLVQMGHVIAAVEIVVHEHLPVAAQTVRPALKEMDRAESGATRCIIPPRKAARGEAFGSRFTKTNCSQVSTRTGSSPFCARSNEQTPSNSGAPFSEPSRP